MRTEREGTPTREDVARLMAAMNAEQLALWYDIGKHIQNAPSLISRLFCKLHLKNWRPRTLSWMWRYVQTQKHWQDWPMTPFVPE